jgi:hypothetical protein
MPVKIKKQYKQPDGTIIEVEGSEAEIEAFEKKQHKQKRQIEESERKKTILYGKDLEEIRKIIQEELKKMPRVENYYDYEHHYHYPQQTNPYWVNPNVIPMINPTINPGWYGTTTTDKITIGDPVSVGGGGSISGVSTGILTTTAAGDPSWSTYTCATGSATNTAPVSVFTSTARMGGVGSASSQKYLMSRS